MKRRKFEGVAVRTSGADDIESRLDRIAEALSLRANGLPVKRGTAARHCMVRGIEAIERELGITTA